MNDVTKICLETLEENILSAENIPERAKAHELLGAVAMLYHLDLITDEEYFELTKKYK